MTNSHYKLMMEALRYAKSEMALFGTESVLRSETSGRIAEDVRLLDEIYQRAALGWPEPKPERTYAHGEDVDAFVQGLLNEQDRRAA